MYVRWYVCACGRSQNEPLINGMFSLCLKRSMGTFAAHLVRKTVYKASFECHMLFDLFEPLSDTIQNITKTFCERKFSIFTVMRSAVSNLQGLESVAGLYLLLHVCVATKVSEGAQLEFIDKTISSISDLVELPVSDTIAKCGGWPLFLNSSLCTHCIEQFLNNSIVF